MLAELRKEGLYMGIPENLVLYAETVCDEAYEISKRLGIKTVLKKPENDILYLKYNGELSVNQGDLELKGDFTRLLNRIKSINSEFLIKAAKPSPQNMTAIDATAGMGEDSLLLAAAGYRVIMYEYDPVIYELLRDALNRAGDIKELSETVKRMELKCEDSIGAMQRLDFAPEVILLDPMFPKRSKSALVKKKFQLLKMLEKPCANGGELLNAAIAAHPGKIIIKRPLKGGYLADKKPSYSIKGKVIRYDCIVMS